MSKKYTTNDYILNVSEVYKNCKPLDTKQPIYASNCEPQYGYYCPLTYAKCWKETPLPTNISIKESNDLVYQNIKNGGVMCEFKPRSNINTMLNTRNLTGYHTNHCNYSKNVETGFYLRHGESSIISKFWSDRHYKK